MYCLLTLVCNPIYLSLLIFSQLIVKVNYSTLSGRSKKAEVNISTVGVDVCDWIYPKKTDFAFGRADNRTSIKFSTWDFGGQVRLGRGR